MAAFTVFHPARTDNVKRMGGVAIAANVIRLADIVRRITGRMDCVDHELEVYRRVVRSQRVGARRGAFVDVCRIRIVTSDTNLRVVSAVVAMQ